MRCVPVLRVWRVAGHKQYAYVNNQIYIYLYVFIYVKILVVN